MQRGWDASWIIRRGQTLVWSKRYSKTSITSPLDSRRRTPVSPTSIMRKICLIVLACKEFFGLYIILVSNADYFSCRPPKNVALSGTLLAKSNLFSSLFKENFLPCSWGNHLFCKQATDMEAAAEEQSQKDWLTAVLPTEVQLWIFSFVRSLPDLLRLSCANKCMKSFQMCSIYPIFFRFIRVDNC